ncbi:MAG TPA: helix-turn-helix domain-containing protein [Tepidisphaeraceae bacterium]|nr:helix-turn-helix domain-containing protein [Tepidisphaeraceae bacterium]
MKTLKKSKTDDPVAGDYLALIRRLPLRRIHSDVEHQVASNIVAELIAKGDEQLSDGEADYLEALARFVSDYECENLLTKLGESTPLEILQHLMESRAMTPSKLGEVLGSRSAASMILKGDREMSKSQIRAIAQYFNVTPALFL